MQILPRKNTSLATTASTPTKRNSSPRKVYWNYWRFWPVCNAVFVCTSMPVSQIFGLDYWLAVQAIRSVWAFFPHDSVRLTHIKTIWIYCFGKLQIRGSTRTPNDSHIAVLCMAR